MELQQLRHRVTSLVNLESVARASRGQEGATDVFLFMFVCVTFSSVTDLKATCRTRGDNSGVCLQKSISVTKVYIEGR